MGTEVTKCGFDSSCATLKEMASCKQIKASHKTDWDPSTVHFNVSLAEKENSYRVHGVSQFEDCSNPSICDTALEHQSASMKHFIDAINITL